MPGPPCNRCKQGAPLPGDTWCLACSAWEAVGRDLAGHWDCAGSRAVATDLLVNCVRQVRALRNLGAGISRASGSRAVADQSRATGSEPSPSTRKEASDHQSSRARSALPRKSSAPPPPKVEKSETEDEGEEEESEESQEEEPPLPGARSLPKDWRNQPGEGVERGEKPRSSRHSSHRKESTGRGEGKPGRSGHHREGRHRERDRDRTRSGKRRGGRKHQRLDRLAHNPELPVHRKQSDKFWELSTEGAGKEVFDRFS